MQKLQTLVSLALVSLVSVAVVGCAEEAPPFPEGQGQEPDASALYPEGPYGIDKGSVIANYEFVGFPNPSLDTGNLRPIQMADFYNPTGEDVYPAGSLYGEGNPKPKALLITVAAVWCGPCNLEARDILPDEYLELHPKGVEFFLNLADGPTGGVPAETKHLVNWTTKYGTSWPSVIDPSYKLSALFSADAFPANLIIDTTTMKIVDVIAGVPDPATSEGQAFKAEILDLVE
jgi:hypothetical protein